MPHLIDALAAQLSGADLTSLLLEVMRQRAAAVTPAALLQRYATDRFVTAPTASFNALRRVEDAVLAACAGRYEAIALAPLVPLGTHSAIATVDQNKVLTTLRNNEVAADPTNALALEAATRRGAALRCRSEIDRRRPARCEPARGARAARFRPRTVRALSVVRTRQRRSRSRQPRLRSAGRERTSRYPHPSPRRTWRDRSHGRPDGFLRRSGRNRSWIRFAMRSPDSMP